MYAENYCTSWLRFFLFLPISVDRKNVGPAEMPWGDYSDLYGVTPCPKFGSVEKHGGKIWVVDANVCKCGRKRLQVGMQTFTSGDANVCVAGLIPPDSSDAAG